MFYVEYSEVDIENTFVSLGDRNQKAALTFCSFKDEKPISVKKE